MTLDNIRQAVSQADKYDLMRFFGLIPAQLNDDSLSVALGYMTPNDRAQILDAIESIRDEQTKE